MKGVRIWLSVVCGFILAMIVLGGATRLTQSGLSIVKWEPLLGVWPPRTEAQWQERFEAYKSATGQASILFPDLTLEKFKPLFLWEYTHRLAGRMTGVVFLVPYLYFLIRRRLSRSLAAKLAAAFLFGGLQGAVGWIMVLSGLNPDSAHVSHIKLAMHLALALALLMYVLWLRMDVDPEAKRWPGPRVVRNAAWAFMAVLWLQIIYGAFTAGLRAGYFYNTFPLMNGMWIPPDAFHVETSWHDLVSNPVTVQLIHRVLGWTIAIGAFTLWIHGRGYGLTGRQQQALRWVMLVSLAQFGLGIATLLLHVPVLLGVAHQLNAALLLCATTMLLHALRGHRVS